MSCMDLSTKSPLGSNPGEINHHKAGPPLYSLPKMHSPSAIESSPITPIPRAQYLHGSHKKGPTN